MKLMPPDRQLFTEGLAGLFVHGGFATIPSSKLVKIIF
jgi:hypothetical protein